MPDIAKPELADQGLNRIEYAWTEMPVLRSIHERFEKENPEGKFESPLFDAELSKPDCFSLLESNGLRLPEMYRLGYHNANCIGCVKGQAGYWNKIRVDFPDVFKARAELERAIGASCRNGVYLDELDPARGRNTKPVCEACGIMCELTQI